MRPLKLFLNFLIRLAGQSPEIASPPNMIPIDDISYDFEAQELRIKIKSPIMIQPNPHNTDSMDGAYDVGHSVIFSSHPDYDKFLQVGAWVWREGQVRVMHSIYEIGEDDEGWWCKTAGLNTGYVDPLKARRKDIKYVGFGVLNTKPKEGIPYYQQGINEWRTK